MEFVGDWFAGDERLWKPFWLGGFLGGFVWSIIMALAGLAGMAVSLFVLVLFLVFQVWILVSMWRCAFNVDWAGWGYIVRVLVVISAVGWIANIVFTVFALATMA